MSLKNLHSRAVLSPKTMNQHTERWEDRFDAKFSGQTQLSQAILDALEYRGFSDNGKYLDDTIAERIAPILKAFIESELAAQIQSFREKVGGMVPPKWEFGRDYADFGFEQAKKDILTNLT